MVKPINLYCGANAVSLSTFFNNFPFSLSLILNKRLRFIPVLLLYIQFIQINKPKIL